MMKVSEGSRQEVRQKEGWMLQGNNVHLKRFSKLWVIALFCTVFIMRILYCKIKRYQIMHSDEFNYEKLQTINNNTCATNTWDPYELEHVINRRIVEKLRMRKEYLQLKNAIKETNNEKHGLQHNSLNTNADDYTVIVIQVQTEDWHLINLLEAIEKANFIKNTLIVFAHYYYDSNINDIILYQIKSFEYIQIFYPFSNQLYKSVFPGQDHKFCYGDYNKCEDNNTERDSFLTQHKHFWWWHVNYVFKQIDLLNFFEGYVLFLRYDDMVSEDFLYMFKRMSKAIDMACPHCDFISLGAQQPDLKKFHYYRNDMYINNFGTTDNNIGIAFNRSTWEKIKTYKEHFCYYNDYKWDESLKYLSTKLPKNLLMLSSAASRVISSNYEDIELDISDYEKYLANMIAYLKLIAKEHHPHDLVVKQSKQSKLKLSTLGGGWEDIRDHEFCMFLVDPHIEKIQELLKL